MAFWLRAALRLPAILFFVATAAFCVLSHIRFTYLQFLRHQLLGWIEGFVLFHPYLFWAAFLLGLLSIADDLKRRLALAFAVTGVFIGVLLLRWPLVTTLGSDDRSLVIGLMALLPPLWLAAIDHSNAPMRLPSGIARRGGAVARLLVASLLTSIYVWFTFAVIAAARWQMSAVSTEVLWPDYVIGTLWSLSAHVAAGSAAFLVAFTTQMTASRRAQYLLSLALLSLATCAVLLQIVFPAIAFHGLRSLVTASIFGVWLAIVWSGLVARQAAAVHSKSDVVEAIVRPIAPARGQVWALVTLSTCAYFVVDGIAVVDWHFLLQTLVAAIVWSIGFALVYRATAAWQFRPAILLAAIVLMTGSTATVFAMWSVRAEGSRLSMAGDRYGAYDGSLVLIERLVKSAPGELADFTTFLVAHSDLPGSRVARPTSIDFEKPLISSGARKPHIFVFAIDSLRRDYLSAYNEAVDFTPAIQAFANHSVVFQNAFTRYGGTGLSEPAIWAGALLPHRQYVTPFAPMNSLEKLIEIEGYDRLVSVDSILRELLTTSPRLRELDAGLQNRLYDSCRTLDEIRAILHERDAADPPIFVFSQPQDLHLANVAIDRTAIPAGTYTGFHPHYAARVERLDRCFGQFVESLKVSGIYDSSIIILTSDHGDSLGDEGRWGHAFTVFPEIVRIPLIVHVPVWLRDAFVDPSAVALSTDVTPTLYKLLGHEPVRSEPLFGETLIGADRDQTGRRRTRPYVIVSSYGPVYGLLTNNASDLYIIDAVNTAEYQYDLRQGLNGVRTTLTERQRRMAQNEIRKQVEAIANFYGYSAE